VNTSSVDTRPCLGPVFTGVKTSTVNTARERGCHLRVRHPGSRAVFTGHDLESDTRVHGPCSQAVNRGSMDRRLNTGRVENTLSCHAFFNTAPTGYAPPVFTGVKNVDRDSGREHGCHFRHG